MSKGVNFLCCFNVVLLSGVYRYDLHKKHCPNSSQRCAEY